MAIPGILQEITRSNPMMGQIKQMMGAVRMAQNPQAALSQLAMSNPNMKKVMDIVSQYGGDANLAFRSIAEQNGIDPQEIMNMLK